MNDHTPTLIINGVAILLFIIWVIYNSIMTNDPLIVDFFSFLNLK